jgi:hypothetical protein
MNAKKREEEKRSKEQTYPASAGIRLKSDQNQTPMQEPQRGNFVSENKDEKIAMWLPNYEKQGEPQ